MLAAAYILGLALFVNAPWALGILGMSAAPDGTRWMITTGLLDLEVDWPITDGTLLATSILLFVLWPLWLRLGVATGFILFGRSPKQTGVLGLLR